MHLQPWETCTAAALKMTGVVKILYIMAFIGFYILQCDILDIEMCSHRLRAVNDKLC